MSRDYRALLDAACFTPRELDTLPFGAIVVDLSGHITAYNDAESKLSHLAKERVVGRNFFTEIAPCTDVQAFAGRMREFFAGNETVSKNFAYEFPFAHGLVHVSITFVRLPDKRSILIAVERAEEGV